MAVGESRDRDQEPETRDKDCWIGKVTDETPTRSKKYFKLARELQVVDLPCLRSTRT
jgi:hypothetical protein